MSANNKYFKLSSEQLNKVGNAMVFLSGEMPGIHKTKLLKLLYLLDEFSIINSGIPFFNLQYKAWKLGPVVEEIFIELSDKPYRFGKYIEIKSTDKGSVVFPKADFCDDEFSDNDIELLEFVAKRFSNMTTKQLIDYTHRPNSPWRKTTEENGVYDLLEQGHINNTEIVIDMSFLVINDERKKSIFEQYIQEK